MDPALDRTAVSLGLDDGDCATDVEAVSDYTVDDQPAGRVACYRFQGRSHIDWTDDLLLIYADAVRADLADVDLLRWWVESAGPLESFPGFAPGSVIPKDLATPLPLAPEGSFAGNVTDKDVAGLPNQLSLLTGSYHLDLSAGTYRLEQSSGAMIDAGSYGLAKGGLITFSSSAETCDETASYRFALDGDELTFELEGKEPCQGRAVILGAGSWAPGAATDSPGEPSPSPTA
jgi:hypothetical protein